MPSVGRRGGVGRLSISPIPWNGPLATVRVGRVDGTGFSIQVPSAEFSDIDLTSPAGRLDLMVEADRSSPGGGSGRASRSLRRVKE